jgi:hypothetical protein
MSQPRISKAFFLYFVCAIAVFFYEKSKDIDIKHKLAMVSIIAISLFNTNMFMSNRFWLQFQLLSSFLFLFYMMITSDLKKEVLIRYIIALCFIESFWVFSASLGHNFYDYLAMLFPGVEVAEKSISYQKYPLGSLNNPNLSGALIAVTMPFFFKKDVWPWLILPATSLYLCDSAMSFLTLIAGVSFYLWNRFTKDKLTPYISFAALGILFLAIGLPESGFFSGQSRYQAWMKSLDYFTSPLFGHGLGWTGDIFRENVFGREYFVQLHNEYLQTLLEMGIVGLFFFVAAWMICALRSRNILVSSSMFAIAVNSYGNFYFHISLLSFVALIIAAIAYNNKEGVL